MKSKDMITLQGTAAAPGLAIGTAHLFSTDFSIPDHHITADGIPVELDRFHQAVQSVHNELEQLATETRKQLSADEAAIFEAHAMFLQDPELTDTVEQLIKDEHLNAAAAVMQGFDGYASMLSALDDEYLQARATDVKEVGRRLAGTLLGRVARGSDCRDVVIADDLGPSDTMSMDHTLVKAMVLSLGGVTTHTAILARSLGIPAVVGLGQGAHDIMDEDLCIVDGDQGLVIVSPTAEVLADYQSRKAAADQAAQSRESLRHLPSLTEDGRSVELWANIGRPQESAQALAAGATGVGLFRTEFLYMDRSTLPSEDEQEQAYRQALSGMKGHPVVIRTLDIGGDKKLPYLPLPEEANPFLGVRAIRLCLQHRDLFRTQLRALLKASPAGQLWIMFPMVATVNELRAAKAELAGVREQLVSEGVQVADTVKVGIMIEIPAAALSADRLAKEADFFSIGTNDLIQYTMAADRQNDNLHGLYQPDHVAVLRLIQMTVAAARGAAIPVGMCGEMAGDPKFTAQLVGLGLNELSMSTSSLPAVKERLLKSNSDQAQKLIQEQLRW